MSETRYGHDKVSSGAQNRGERKDEGWEPRQGGSQSRRPGRAGDAEEPSHGSAGVPPPGTNTQGELPGIGEASDATRSELERMWQRGFPSDDADARKAAPAAGDDRTGDDPSAGTDQPPRMGGPLGPDPERPHLPEGDQNGETRGTGARGYDVGVDASTVGAVHQGVKEEDVRDRG